MAKKGKKDDSEEEFVLPEETHIEVERPIIVRETDQGWKLYPNGQEPSSSEDETSEIQSGNPERETEGSVPPIGSTSAQTKRHSGSSTMEDPYQQIIQDAQRPLAHIHPTYQSQLMSEEMLAEMRKPISHQSKIRRELVNV